MTTNTIAIDPPSRRLVVVLPAPYDEAREQYETLVPEVDFARFFQMASWQATLELAEINAPHGFMRYYRGDVTATMAGSTSLWKATQYLMGNHTIAERMFRHEPSLMLYAPLRTVIWSPADGSARFTLDKPSDHFGSFANADITAVGVELDRKVAALLEHLGLEVPEVLLGS